MKVKKTAKLKSKSIAPKPENLSEAALKRSIYSNNKSGVKGVSFNQKKQKWCAFIYINGKSKGLGSFATRDQAIEARQAAENSNRMDISSSRFVEGFL